MSVEREREKSGLADIEVVGKRGELGRKVQLKVKMAATNVTAYSKVREKRHFSELSP